MTNRKTVRVPGDKVFSMFDVDSGVPRCERGTQAENYAHDMEAVDITDDGPTLLYCRRGCGLTQKLEVPS